MPQVVSGQTGYLGGETGGQGNGVGAVIFDAPSVNRANAGNMLFQALQSNAKLLNDQDIAKQKTAQSHALGALNGLNLSKEGILENDIPEFSNRMKEFYDKRAELEQQFSTDPTSPEKYKKLNDLRQEQKQYEMDVNQSATHKKMVAKAIDEVTKKGDEYEQAESLKNIEEYVNTPRDKRSMYAKELLVPFIKDLGVEAEPIVGKIKPQIVEVATGNKLPNGQFEMVKTEQYTPTQINGLAKELVTGERTMKSTEKQFNRLNDDEKSFFKLLADSETASAKSTDPNAYQITPQEMYARNYLENRLSGEKITRKQLAQDNASKLSLAQGKYDIQHQDDAYSFDQANNFMNGAVGVLDGVVKQNIALPIPMGGQSVIPSESYTVSNMVGKKVGVFQNSTPKYDPNGNLIEGAYSLQNVPELIVKQTISKMPDGSFVPMIITNKTIMDAGYDIKGFNRFDDPNVWKKFDNSTMQNYVSTNKLKVNQTDKLKQVGGYDNKIPQTQKLTTAPTLPMQKTAPVVVAKTTTQKVEQPKQQPPKMTANEWNKKWGELKKGQTLVGLDGKTYTKK
jgi:hypothetical protein